MSNQVPCKKNHEALIEKLIHLKYPQKYRETKVPFGHIFAAWADLALEPDQELFFKHLTLNAQEQIRQNFIEQMSRHHAATLASSLHQARESWELHGDTPQDRYFYFIEKIFPEPKFLQNFFTTFPVFSQTLSTQMILFTNKIKEFLTRIKQDQNDLEKTFNAYGKIEKIHLSLSDPHNENRSVFQIEFENQTSLVYKPKSMGLERAYNHFLKNLDAMGLSPSLKTYTVLDKGEYGWVESIRRIGCKKQEEAKQYYFKFGMLISLMHIFRATDFHYENIIECGENPVLIDLETLFLPDWPTKNPELVSWKNSVLQTGFFPTRRGSLNSIDVSPLTGELNEELSQPVGMWQDVNTDRMQFSYQKKTIVRSIPRPILNGKLTAATDYTGELIEGFTKMHNFISENKEKVISALQPLFDHSVRVILRSTDFYSKIIKRLSDPQLMRSHKQLNEKLKILDRSIELIKSQKRVLSEEKRSLKNLDIPLFTSHPKDCHLYARAKILARNFFNSSSKTLVIERIKNLDKNDLQQQLNYIEHSLYQADPATSSPLSDPLNGSPLLSKGEFRKVALEIGEKIGSLSEPSTDGTRSWICLEFEPRNHKYLFTPISDDLYSGKAGIALFFAALKKKKFVQIADKIIDQIKTPFYADPELALRSIPLTGMTDIGGLIYVLNSIGNLLNRPDYIKDALYLATLISDNQIKNDTSYDLLSGSAGIILVLLSLYQTTGQADLLKTCKIAGNHLIEAAQPMAQGCSWGEKKLCGLAHGNAGIAYALFKLGALAKTTLYLKTAMQALEYERSCFSKQHGNWPDRRESPPSYTMCAWCTGAAGIGLSRIYIRKYYMDAEIENEIAAAKNATLAHLVGRSDHLCCGNFGRIAFLWALDPSDETAHQLASKLVHNFQKSGSLCCHPKLPQAKLNPGFMQGIAGIGYLLLQMSHPENLSNFPLVLE